MELGCPVCNGFIMINKNCPCCAGGLLEDKGTLEDFYGPYSPYENQELYEPYPAAGGRDCRCIHLLACAACGFDERVGICQIIM